MFIQEDDNQSKIQLNQCVETINKMSLKYATEIYGVNPKIFTYQFLPQDDDEPKLLVLTFYEYTKVYVVMQFEGE
jgi:hypothetical protein